MTTAELPRGVRNFNPGNIRDGEPWQGLVGKADDHDVSFCVFKDPTWGIRAICRILIGYQDNYGIRTIRGVINRWAPSVENDTNAYIAAVDGALDFAGADDQLDLHTYAHLKPLVEALIRHENGKGPLSTPNTWYGADVVDTGLTLAGVVKPAAVVAKVPVTRESVAASLVGSAGIAQLADVAPRIADTINLQQDNITSGQILRIGIAVVTIALAAFIAWSQVKKHMIGVVA